MAIKHHFSIAKEEDIDYLLQGIHQEKLFLQLDLVKQHRHERFEIKSVDSDRREFVINAPSELKQGVKSLAFKVKGDATEFELRDCSIVSRGSVELDKVKSHSELCVLTFPSAIKKTETREGFRALLDSLQNTSLLVRWQMPPDLEWVSLKANLEDVSALGFKASVGDLESLPWGRYFDGDCQVVVTIEQGDSDQQSVICSDFKVSWSRIESNAEGSYRLVFGGEFVDLIGDQKDLLSRWVVDLQLAERRARQKSDSL